MILAAPGGPRFEDLTPEDQIDAAYAAMIEPHAHGAWMSIDAIVTAWDDVFTTAFPDDRDAFGMSTAAERGLAKADEVFGQAPARAPAPPSEDRARGVVTSGHPFEWALVMSMRSGFAAAARVASTLLSE